MSDREKVEKLAEAIQQTLYAGSNRAAWAKIKAYAEALVAAEAAADWVLHVAHGVGRSGESPTGEEYTEALDSLEAALAKAKAVMTRDSA